MGSKFPDIPSVILEPIVVVPIEEIQAEIDQVRSAQELLQATQVEAAFAESYDYTGPIKADQERLNRAYLELGKKVFSIAEEEIKEENN
jgi:hypothetical protein